MARTMAAKKPSAPRKPVTTKQVVDWVRDRIRVGKFVPGQRLVEADIIKATGASRAKVRESLQRLETEGLVVIEEYRGASVKIFTWEQVHQIYRTRAVLEGLAAAEFAAQDDPEGKRKLRALQDALDAMDNTGDHQQFAQLNSEWHNLIIERSGNEYLRLFLTQLSVPIYRLLFSTFYSSQRIALANADHRKITAAIVKGDADKAEEAMREHVNQGLVAISGMDSQFFGEGPGA
jgi:DNA-binding GntR family transcriptional regulator